MTSQSRAGSKQFAAQAPQLLTNLAMVIVSNPSFDRELAIKREDHAIYQRVFTTFLEWMPRFLTIVSDNASRVQEEAMIVAMLSNKILSILVSWTDAARCYLLEHLVCPWLAKHRDPDVPLEAQSEAVRVCDLLEKAIGKDGVCDFSPLTNQTNADLNSLSLFFFSVNSDEPNTTELSFLSPLWSMFVDADYTSKVYQAMESVIWEKCMILGLIPPLVEVTDTPDENDAAVLEVRNPTSKDVDKFNECLRLVHRAARKIALGEYSMFRPRETLQKLSCRILYLLVCPNSMVRQKAEQLLYKATETDLYVVFHA